MWFHKLYSDKREDGDLVFTSSEIYGVVSMTRLLSDLVGLSLCSCGNSIWRALRRILYVVQNAVVGKSGDRFRINVTSTWQNRSVSAELLVPPGGKGGDAYDKAV